MIRLNLGCGPDIKDGYINIDTCPLNDKVIKMDITNLDYSESSVDEVYARDVLEHMPIEIGKKCIANWAKICKPNAKLFIQTICWDTIIQAYYANIWDIEAVNYMLFAGTNWVDGISRPEDFHKSVYTLNFLCGILKQNNFKIDKVSTDKIDESLLRNKLAHNLNMMIYASKI